MTTIIILGAVLLLAIILFRLGWGRSSTHKLINNMDSYTDIDPIDIKLLSIKAQKTIRRLHIIKVGDLKTLTAKNIISTKGVGKITCNEIIDWADLRHEVTISPLDK